MILANGCNITKSEKFKGVWILSVPTVCVCIFFFFFLFLEFYIFQAVSINECFKINFWLAFKGLVHTKMKILSLITHPHVFPNL